MWMWYNSIWYKTVSFIGGRVVVECRRATCGNTFLVGSNLALTRQKARRWQCECTFNTVRLRSGLYSSLRAWFTKNGAVVTTVGLVHMTAAQETGLHHFSWRAARHEIDGVLCLVVF